MSVFNKLISFIDKGVVEQTPFKRLSVSSSEVLTVSLKGSELVLTKLLQPIGDDIYIITLDGDYIGNLLSQSEKEILFSNAAHIIEAKKLLEDANKKVVLLNKLDSILGD